MSQPLKVNPGTSVHLEDFNPGFHDGLDKEEGLAKAAKNADALDELAYKLYAEHRRALLIVLQGMDTSGKDGVIRHVMSRVSPQNCKVVSFKVPNAEEREHDFLWRIHRSVPPAGSIGIFNRSHYEDVLVVRVHELVEKSEWKSRYAKINKFERFLTDEGTTILKFFLHIGRDEQRKRLLARIDDPHKCWKISEADVAERKFWDDYQRAYEDALTECNTDYAPWYVVPSDHKWYRNLIVGRIVREALEEMNPKYPPPPKDLAKLVID